MKTPPEAEAPKPAPPPKPTCPKCESELTRGELLLREGPGSFKTIAIFRLCIKCGYSSRWRKEVGRYGVEDQLWDRLRRMNLFVVESAPGGGLRPWVSDMLRNSELGKEMLKKHGLYTEELDKSVYVPGADEIEPAIEEEPF